METIQDFEDLLNRFAAHEVRYLIVGGLAFIYHAKPRYTKDMDLWVDPRPENVAQANAALAEFGSPSLLPTGEPRAILQIGVAPNRIDILLDLEGFPFEEAWERRIEGSFGQSTANWIDIDTLIAVKSAIDHPRHQEDARVLRQVRDRYLKNRPAE